MIEEPTTARVRSVDVVAALRARHAAPEWAILFEVPNATGGAAARRADAIAMSLWPSRGLEVHGFEIKVDRRDWLRELKAPQKAEEIARFCDRWWIAAAPGVVKEGELPPGWGLLVLRGASLRQEREAPAREGVVPTRAFLASMLRAAVAQSPAEEAVRAAVDRAREEERKAAKTSADLVRGQAAADLEALKKAVSDFEAASGVRITRWDGQAIGEAVRFVMGGGLRMKRTRLESFAEQLRRTLEECDKALAIDLEAADPLCPATATDPGTGFPLRCALTAHEKDVPHLADGLQWRDGEVPVALGGGRR